MKEKISKLFIAERVAKKKGMETEVAREIIDEFLCEIKESLAQDNEVFLWGFGKFIARPYGKRKCYNPATGKIIQLNESISPVFIPGEPLRRALNSK